MPNTNASVGADGPLELPSREGTTQAFGHILSSHLTSLYRNAYRMLGNRGDAVQDARLAADGHSNQFKGQSEVSTWVAAIVHNCAPFQLRKRRRHVCVSLGKPTEEPEAVSGSEQLADDWSNPDDECEHSELSTRLAHFRSRPSPILSRTFWLRDIEGISIRETERILRIPRGKVKAQSARARQTLKELMQRARLLIALLIVLAVELYSRATPGKHYVPLTCMARLTITNFGLCSRNGQRWRCPNTDMTFVEECSSPKPVSGVSTFSVQHPTALLTEDK